MATNIEISKNKGELTVKQYEFYKRKSLSDEKIMAMHNMHTVAMNKWKKENNLIGVKFEPEVKVSQHVTISPFAVVPSSSSVDSKTQTISQTEVMERHNSQNNAQEYPTASPMHNIEHISPEHLNAINAALGNELDNRVDLDKLQRESDEETIAELMDDVAGLDQRLLESMDNARGWERNYYEELECSAMWRDKFLDMERQKNKLEQTVSVETSNRKYAEKLMDETLIAKYQDEQLLELLAAKFVTVSKRNLEQ